MRSAVWILLVLVGALCFPAAARAQYQAPSTELSPYEQQRYGSSLWEVPREPYQGEFERYKRGYIPPVEDVAPTESLRGRNPGETRRSPSVSSSAPSRRGRTIQTEPGGRTASDAAVKRRFQTDMKLRDDQRKISERSRIPAPAWPTSRPKTNGDRPAPAFNQSR